MENNNFEKDIKGMFNQHQPELNTDEIWDVIEPKLKKKKKRRFFIFWLLGAGILLTSVGLFYHFSNSAGPSQIAKTETLEIKPSTSSNIDAIQDTESYTDEKTLKVLTQENNTNQESKPIAFAKVKTDKIKQNTKKIRQEKNSFPKNINTTRELSDHSTKNSNQQQLSLKDSPETSLRAEEAQTTKESTVKEEIGEEEEKEKKLLSPPKNAKDEVKLKKKKSKKKRRKRIRPRRRANWEIQLQAAASPILPYKRLKYSTFSDFAGNQYLAKRKESEKQLEAFGFNIGLHFQNKRSGLTLVSAIEYRQFNERFNHFFEEVETTTETGTISVTEDQQGNVINSTSGPKLVTTTRTEEQKRYNQHRFISIPIGIGRAWSQNKHNWKLMGGLDFNLLYNFRGTIYNTNFSQVEFDRNSNKERYKDIFKKSAGIGLWLSGEYSRTINKRSSWVFAPKFQIPLSSTTKSDFILQQKFYALQFDVGINYLLNPKKDKK